MMRDPRVAGARALLCLSFLFGPNLTTAGEMSLTGTTGIIGACGSGQVTVALYGTITEGGQPVANRWVWIIISGVNNGSPLQVLTDANGNYATSDAQWYDLDAGCYYITSAWIKTATKDDPQGLGGPVTARGNGGFDAPNTSGSVRQNFDLSPVSPP